MEKTLRMRTTHEYILVRTDMYCYTTGMSADVGMEWFWWLLLRVRDVQSGGKKIRRTIFFNAIYGGFFLFRIILLSDKRKGKFSQTLRKCMYYWPS